MLKFITIDENGKPIYHDNKTKQQLLTKYVLSFRNDDSQINLPDDFAEFNKLIGLPKHPIHKNPIGLMPYQKEFHKKIPRNRQIRFHVNKARQIGFTELVLRVLAYESFHKYAGGQIFIIVGTRQAEANKLMYRFKRLFENIPGMLQDWKPGMRTTSVRPKGSLALKNGTLIQALPSSSSSIRGETNVKAIFIDEAAHFDLVDDSEVLDAIEPIVYTNQSDLFMISTPNGRRGFFYEISKNPEDYMTLVYSYEHTLGLIFTQEEWDKELSKTDIDVQQEYMNQFTTTRRSYYGDVFTTGEHEEEVYDV